MLLYCLPDVLEQPIVPIRVIVKQKTFKFFLDCRIWQKYSHVAKSFVENERNINGLQAHCTLCAIWLGVERQEKYYHNQFVYEAFFHRKKMFTPRFPNSNFCFSPKRRLQRVPFRKVEKQIARSLFPLGSCVALVSAARHFDRSWQWFRYVNENGKILP